MVIFKNKIDREVFWRFSFLLAFVVLCIITVLAMPVMMASVLTSMVMAYLMYPLIKKMESKGIARAWGIIIVYSMVAVLVALTYQQSYSGLFTQVETFQAEFPNMARKILAQVSAWESSYTHRLTFLDDLKLVQRFESYGIGLAEKVFSSIPGFLSSILTLLIMVPFFTFFLVKDAEKIKKWLLDMLPNRYLEAGSALIFNINRQVEGFIQARLLEAAVVGLLVYIGLLIFGLPYVLFLSVFAAVFNLVPYIGPIIGAVPGVIVAYFYAGTDTAVWITIVIYTFAQMVDFFLIIPMVVAKRVKIHPMTVVVLIIIGSSVMGILGMVLAVPVYGILKAIFRAISTRIMVTQ